ncbi:AAA domain, putative AbiEii toxin, type IV TA system [Kordia sp. SMS9]|uniref:AAA family ATPase n=1 Tax=Kordia sp. SMS9 TaxID=2282170 RepID=UPI000E0DFC98|nr:AAA family ATPase [Kordia sp. SMS9]AXG70968.1 AAA domain, putative AbiEii toxin, type IV TA system [Kordia sp. SMS9]
MIHIDRTSVQIPEALLPNNKRVIRELEEAKAFFEYAEHSRGQRRFRFKNYLDRSIRKTLQELFHGKCAYCESSIMTTFAGDLEHYRPKGGVAESSDHTGYWWLVNDWDNLLISCRNCNVKKKNHFPIKDETQRVFTSEDDLTKEEPLVLNPCIDYPEDHFMYTDDGTIVSKTERGKASILLLNLNRKPLVYARENEVRAVKASISRINSMMNADVKDEQLLKSEIETLQKMTASSEEYAGIKRQYVLAFLKEFGADRIDNKRFKHTKTYSDEEKRAVTKEYEDFTQKVESSNMYQETEKSSMYMLKEHFVAKIELTNVKTYENQEFNLVNDEGSFVLWLMLLGENGTGKSTVLKSLCMNLCDIDYFQNMIRMDLIDPTSFIKHHESKATIKVWMTGSKNPRILELKKDSVTFTNMLEESVSISLPLSDKNIQSDVWSSPTFLLGYGATRLLPRGSKHEATNIINKLNKVDNLFNPFVPLGNAEQWLLNLDEKLFRRAAIIIKDLLRIPDDKEIKRTETEVKIYVNNHLETFKDLSDGYQSVMALTTDILQLVMNFWENPDEARGIVIIDEIGAHLHPQWKMRIVSSIRNAFKNMQFIASTHQPLCLRGLDQGEVILMRRDADKHVEVITELPNPRELRIGQILTSVFGLSSTMDPELEAEFNRYFELRAMNSRTPEEDDEMSDLEAQLKPDLLLGETLLNTQEYKIVKEKYEFYKKNEKPSNLEKLSDDTLSAVQELWKS